MKTVETDIIILGAGLTGLCLAYFLKAEDQKAVILEARDRLGGRIYTKQEPNCPPVELGATWISEQHLELRKIIHEMGLDLFEQELGETAIYEPISTSPHQVVSLPDSDSPSYRIKHGTQKLIERLVLELEPAQIYTGQKILEIGQVDDKISAISDSHRFVGSVVISTLPPQLFVNDIRVNPSLPKEVSETAKVTHTWMGESIKISLCYRNRFWNEKQLSGTIFSNVGPITEMYDQSNYEQSLFALTGFFNGAYFGIRKEERLELALKQLEKYYGGQVRDYLSYEELVWKNEDCTSVPSSDYIFPHQHNGHAVYQKSYLNKRLYLAGTETSPVHGGYMEGAIHSAKHIYSQLKSTVV